MANIDLTDQKPLSQHEIIINDLAAYIRATDHMLALMSRGRLDTGAVVTAMLKLCVDRGNAKGRAIHNGFLWPDE